MPVPRRDALKTTGPRTDEFDDREILCLIESGDGVLFVGTARGTNR